MLKPWLAAEKGNSNHDAAIAPIESLIGRVIHGPSALRRLFLRPNRFSLPAPQTLMANSLFAVAISSHYYWACQPFFCHLKPRMNGYVNLCSPCIASCLRQVSPIKSLSRNHRFSFFLPCVTCHTVTDSQLRQSRLSKPRHMSTTTLLDVLKSIL